VRQFSLSRQPWTCISTVRGLRNKRADRIRIFPPATNTVPWPPPVVLNDQTLPAFENPLGPLAAVG
jgi:hypothetical protein